MNQNVTISEDDAKVILQVLHDYDYPSADRHELHSRALKILDVEIERLRGERVSNAISAWMTKGADGLADLGIRQPARDRLKELQAEQFKLIGENIA